jgi:hypothetical protein
MCNPVEYLIMPQPIATTGTGVPNNEAELLARLKPGTVFLMGDNPALPTMPERPTLVDFFERRGSDITVRHLLSSATRAAADGHEDKVVMACLLHDISNLCLIRADHGYWGAQMIAPYVDPEIAWAVEKHQALRYFADEAAGYAYPESYIRFFGPDYVPPDYIQREAAEARDHKWYMTARLVTMNDLYAFEPGVVVEIEEFEDLIGRNFKQPVDGLGNDNSPSTHMWRTIIAPTRFL